MSWHLKVGGSIFQVDLQLYCSSHCYLFILCTIVFSNNTHNYINYCYHFVCTAVRFTYHFLCIILIQVLKLFHVIIIIDDFQMRRLKVIVLVHVQFSSVAQSCLMLCDPMNHNTPGLPVHHQLLESTQTYIHHVGDAIQPSHPLSSPSPPALNLSQHQGLFK